MSADTENLVVYLPITERNPFYHEGETVCILRLPDKDTGRQCWQIGESYWAGVNLSVQPSGDVEVVRVRHMPLSPDHVDYGELIYRFHKDDWKKVFRLDIHPNPMSVRQSADLQE